MRLLVDGARFTASHSAAAVHALSSLCGHPSARQRRQLSKMLCEALQQGALVEALISLVRSSEALP